MDNKWEKFLDIIKDQVSHTNFRGWFSNTRLEKWDHERVVIAVPSVFSQEQLSKRYGPILEQAVQTVFGSGKVIEYKIDPSMLKKKTKGQPEDGEEQDEEEELELHFTPTNLQQNNTGLNPKYTLESFVVGLSNNLAFAAAQAVIQNPGTTYNPLFIYGGTGVGKTHLMQAIGNALLEKNPSLKLIYCSSEKFTNDFIQSLQTKKNNEFRSKYRSCDLLLIDDIQFIAGRDSTQEEFFHTFNELYTKNSQIILTSDRPPAEMTKLESRLSSRFQGGLMVDIQVPDFDTRIAILRAKCQERGDVVSEECLRTIAERVETNARELEGKLIQIVQSCKLLNQPVTVENILRFLGQTPQVQITQKIDHKKVFTGINQYFNIKMVDLTGPKRKKELVFPRQLAMYILYEDCHIPFERIGDLLGGRDHTTVMYGVDKIRQEINRDRETQRILIEIKQLLASN